jgi:transaldolase
MNSHIQHLRGFGQSIWYDNIERRLLENGQLAGMIRRGEIQGLTSNPSIFHNAIAKSNDYDADLLPLAEAGKSTEEIFETLAVADIREAADLMRPLYDNAGKGDGYASLEVSPNLAYDTATTLSEAKRLWAWVDRPNLMIKIPATKEGLPAIRAAIAAGINVNVTLIFSIERYRAVMDAYLSGLEDRIAAGQPIDSIASVASFFVSRIDVAVDKQLAALGSEQAAALLGKTAIANARLAYQAFKEVFGAERFTALRAQGARYQRPLWASTGTKNPDYSDTLFVDELIGPDTVNTIPPATLAAFIDHGQPGATLEKDLPDAQQVFTELEALGISLADVTQQLEDAGVKAFADAFAALLATIDQRRSVPA